MRATRSPWWLPPLVALLAALPASAQQQPQFPAVRLTALTPPGGKAGTTVELACNGFDLDDVTDLWFSQAGFKAERLPDPPPDKQKNPQAPMTVKFKVTVPADAPVGASDVRLV